MLRGEVTPGRRAGRGLAGAPGEAVVPARPAVLWRWCHGDALAAASHLARRGRVDAHVAGASSPRAAVPSSSTRGRRAARSTCPPAHAPALEQTRPRGRTCRWCAVPVRAVAVVAAEPAVGAAVVRRGGGAGAGRPRRRPTPGLAGVARTRRSRSWWRWWSRSPGRRCSRRIPSRTSVAPRCMLVRTDRLVAAAAVGGIGRRVDAASATEREPTHAPPTQAVPSQSAVGVMQTLPHAPQLAGLFLRSRSRHARRCTRGASRRTRSRRRRRPCWVRTRVRTPCSPGGGVERQLAAVGGVHVAVAEARRALAHAAAAHLPRARRAGCSRRSAGGRWRVRPRSRCAATPSQSSWPAGALARAAHARRARPGTRGSSRRSSARSSSGSASQPLASS